VPLPRIENVELTDGALGSQDRGFEQPRQAVADLRNRVPLEEIGAVFDAALDAGRGNRRLRDARRG
jgi:hypothetical protein